MNKLLLNLALLPSGIWKSMGADTDQLRALLDVKLKLDDRKPVNFGKQKAQNKNRRFSLAVGMLLSLFTGLLYLFPLFILHQKPLIAFTSFFTLFLFLLTFTLIADFSTVLIDTRDKSIVLPRPVNDRTLFLSRMLHIFIYLFRIVLPMSLPGWISIGILFGWKAALWFPIPMALVLFTALFLVMGAYLLILKVAPVQRFKDILGYFQIFISIFVFASVYVGPRTVSMEQVQSISLADFPWVHFLPSFWIASTWSWVTSIGLPANSIYYSLLAVVFPMVCLFLALKFFAPQFAAKLGGLDAADQQPPTKTRTVKGQGGYLRLSQWFNKRDEARAGFMLTWLQTGRSRSFKMKIYPTFAYVPIYFLYLLLGGERSLTQVLDHMPETSSHLILLYMCSSVMLQAMGMVTVSEQYKAAWVYYSLPLQEPGAILAGTFKAMWVKYFLPFFIAVSIFVLVVWGAPALIDVVLALVNVTLFSVCVARMSVRTFPFSKIDQMDNSGSRVIRVIATMAIPFTLGFAHYAAMHFWWLKLLFLALAGILLWLVWDSYAHTQWADMKKVDE